MERLTKRGQFGDAYFTCGNCPNDPGECSKHFGSCAMVLADRLADYEDAEEHGLLVRLPCKIGSTLYVLRGDVSNGWETLKPTHIETVKFTLGCLDKNLNLYPNYYLTREEAEAALAKEDGT